jgi:hypothetical protein
MTFIPAPGCEAMLRALPVSVKANFGIAKVMPKLKSTRFPSGVKV